MELDEFDYIMKLHGWVLFEGVLAPDSLPRLKADIRAKQEECRGYQIKNGIAANMEGTAHHVIGSGNSLDEFLTHFYLDPHIRRYFDGPYILNSFGAAINQPAGMGSYVHNVHRDVRTYSHPFRLLLNMLVMLDDFTLENGATRVLSGSHQLREKPADAFFDGNAVSLTGRAGSIVLFDSNLWHAAGRNTTDQVRAGLTLTFSRPFFKQQLDYPRFLSSAYEQSLSPQMRQLLGYDARVPSSYDEWYQPPEKRMYKPGQG